MSPTVFKEQNYRFINENEIRNSWKEHFGS
jgi:hypothetical protein